VIALDQAAPQIGQISFFSLLCASVVVKLLNGFLMTRRNLFVANWKMHKTIAEALEYFRKFLPLVHPKVAADVYLAPAFTAIYALVQAARSSNVLIGAQNMSEHAEGAFTGEISAAMLLEAGAQFVILGHSERRRIFREEDALINRKVALAIKSGLIALLCIGETQEERSAGKTISVIERQLAEGLKGIESKSIFKLTLAYEPVWAIGNGRAATPQDAEEVQAFARQFIADKWGSEAASQIRILYGGSVNAQNAKKFLMEEDIDGLLVGGASLDAASFSDIINLN